MKLPRFFGKKRGHRRTGSQAWGSFGEGLFYCGLLVIGLIFAGLLLSGLAVPEWRSGHNFIQTRCTVVGKGLSRHTVINAQGTSVQQWQPCLRVRYQALQLTRDSWSKPLRGGMLSDRPAALKQLAAWKLGEELTCWYDPADSQNVVLERGYNWWMWSMALVLPSVLIIFGGSGLMRAVRVWGKSEERRAASAGLPELFESTDYSPAEAPGYPGVPTCDDLINSPGTILRYRLPVESPESWTLLGFGLFAILWNAVVAVLAVGAGLNLLGGHIDWLLFALLVPFVAVGIASISIFLRSLVLASAVGTSQLEISDHPLRPGQRYDVLLGQGGSGTFRTLKLYLEAEEQATFRQGTDTRTERLIVWSRQIMEWKDMQLTPGIRFETRVSIDIPVDAMHSLTSEHNAVSWRIVVQGTPERWPSFTRIFPVVIFPSADNRLLPLEKRSTPNQELTP